MVLGISTMLVGACASHAAPPPRATSRVAPSVSPSRMAQVGTVDDRYQSYNVEMLEVTGGRFCAPYGPELDAVLAQATAPAAPAAEGSDEPSPAGMDPRLYRHRPPLDLTQPRLRTLAAALGPAYVRVSGTWANATYFAGTEDASAEPPAGFDSVLTHAQWRSVVELVRAVDGEIVTSFATSDGTRDDSGVWTPTHARRWLAHTRSIGGRIAAAEFMNEPTLAAMGGAPPGYDAADYARDFRAFRAFARAEAPDLQILGPGSVAENDGDFRLSYSDAGVLATSDLLAAVGPNVYDAFSYHHYGATS